jgi:hypothetical protein
MELDPGLVVGIVGMALLFALVGLIPLAHRSCGECGGDCSSCVLDDPPLPSNETRS